MKRLNVLISMFFDFKNWIKLKLEKFENFTMKCGTHTKNGKKNVSYATSDSGGRQDSWMSPS